jgi:anti-sigma factor (TIGR02949 family)
MESTRDEPIDDAVDQGDAAVSCEDVGRDLDAHVDREFGTESTIVVGDHLSGCATCRQRVAEREALRRLVRSAPYYSAPERLRARVLEQAIRSDWVRHFLT